MKFEFLKVENFSLCSEKLYERFMFNACFSRALQTCVEYVERVLFNKKHNVEYVTRQVRCIFQGTGKQAQIGVLV